jgi:hypothetical protein
MVLTVLFLTVACPLGIFIAQISRILAFWGLLTIWVSKAHNGFSSALVKRVSFCCQLGIKVECEQCREFPEASELCLPCEPDFKMLLQLFRLLLAKQKLQDGGNTKR